MFGVSVALLHREEAHPPTSSTTPITNGRARIPAHRALQQGSKPKMRRLATRDASVRMELEVCPLMRRNLQNHKGKSQLEDTLQRHQAPQRVVVSLLRCRQKMHNQQHLPTLPSP